MNGDYWHVNPDFYDVKGNDNNKKPLSNQQKEIVNSNHEVKRNSELESYGYRVIVLWENDIYKDLDKIMNNTMSLLKSQ